MQHHCEELVDVLKGLQIANNERREMFENKLFQMRAQEGFVRALVTITNTPDQVIGF